MTGTRVADTDQPLFGAIAVGAVAAFLGGGMWAVIVLVTNYEVGWVAWAVGGLVGFAMSRATPVRGRQVATFGALMAVVGLLTGKLLIIAFAARSGLAREIANDPNLMTRAALHDLQSTETLAEDMQTQLDALGPADTLSDSLWMAMQAAAAEHADSMSAEGKAQLADAYARTIMASIGTTGMLRAQLGPWDLLWFLLALTTAWRMLSGAPAVPAPAEKPADEPESHDG
jgi:hypothetical protein